MLKRGRYRRRCSGNGRCVPHGFCLCGSSLKGGIGRCGLFGQPIVLGSSGCSILDNVFCTGRDCVRPSRAGITVTVRQITRVAVLSMGSKGRMKCEVSSALSFDSVRRGLRYVHCCCADTTIGSQCVFTLCVSRTRVKNGCPFGSGAIRIFS